MKLCSRHFARFDTKPECDGQMDGCAVAYTALALWRTVKMTKSSSEQAQQ